MLPVPRSDADESAQQSIGSAHDERITRTARVPAGELSTHTQQGDSSQCETGISLPPSPPGYDLLSVLGNGGMGDVYLAREHATERLVAMKFLRSSGNRSAVERFLVEVRAIASLKHANIIEVLATDFMRVNPFFTTEQATGGSLEKWIRQQGLLAPEEAARLCATLARAVAAMHLKGLLHRDLKPSNVLLFASTDSEHAAPGPSLGEWVPKISDFGLAKRTDQDDGVTVGSAPIGTPSFMPPEQISKKNGEVGPAADVYGLGATLYYTLTGHPPYGPGAPSVVMHEVLTGLVPAPRSRRPELPPDLDGIVVKCLEKDPRDRYATAAALAEDLEKFLAGKRPEAPRHTAIRRGKRWLGRHRIALCATALFLVVASGLVGDGVVLRRAADPVAEIRRDLAQGRQVTLVAATGRPQYSRFILEPNTLGESPAADGSVSFHSFDYGLLELCPEPGIERYRVTLEIRQFMARPLAPNATLETDFCGLYFGFASGKSLAGLPVHGMYCVSFKEYRIPRPAGAPQDHAASFHTVGLTQHPDKTISMSSSRLKAVPFVPQGRPGPWRRIAFEVSPDGITVYWFATDGNPQLLAAFDAATCQQKFADMRKPSRLNAPELPEWTPNSPFGIFSYRSHVAVRNVYMTPLP